jgi:glutaredoxin
MLSAALLSLLLSVSPALAQAQKHLAAGAVDEVFFALDGQALPAAEAPAAADLLAEASRLALGKKDGVMALSLAQMGLKQVKAHPASLEAAARASRALEQFEQAEAFASQWILAQPDSPGPRVLRAELAVENGEWSLALDQLAQVKNPGPLEAKLIILKARATKELRERTAAMTSLSSLERQVMAAAAEVKRSGRTASLAAPSAKGGGSGQVIVYGTSWCGYCKKARAWLTKKGIPFEDKDVEKDQGAAQELVVKAQAQGVRPTGVPVIDMRGKLVLGFDEAKLESMQ